MSDTKNEIERRTKVALDAIKQAYGTSGHELGVTGFVTHHIEELPDEYWQEHCGDTNPKPEQVLNVLVLRSHWSEEDDDGIDIFDFTVPGDVTDYVISVSFDENGEVENIVMES